MKLLDSMADYREIIETLRENPNLSAFDVYNPLSRDGGLALYVDDYANDTREVVNVSFQYDHYTYSRLWDYDSDKHTWNAWQVSGKWCEWESRKGLKALRELLSELSKLITYYPNGKFAVYPTRNSVYVGDSKSFDYFAWMKGKGVAR